MLNVFNFRYGLVLSVALIVTGCATQAGKTVIQTSAAPSALGPYSQAIRVGNVVYLSGQIPLNPKTGEVVAGSIEAQTQQVLENLQAVLAANAMTLADVVSTTVYLKDLNDFAKMNAIYGNYFVEKPPARATVQVARLPRDVLLEIATIANK